MIEISTSRSGHPILKIGDRYTASSFDPVSEGKTWAANVAALVGDSEAVVILGMGSGYHVSALSESISNRIIVLDPDPEVIDLALGWHPSIKAEWVFSESNQLALTQIPSIQDVLTGMYLIAHHGPSCQIRPDWSREMSSFLIGRDKLSFMLQLRMRPELLALLNPELISKIPDEPISIKTLQRLFLECATDSRERRMWRCLEELVL